MIFCHGWIQIQRPRESHHRCAYLISRHEHCRFACSSISQGSYCCLHRRVSWSWAVWMTIVCRKKIHVLSISSWAVRLTLDFGSSLAPSRSYCCRTAYGRSIAWATLLIASSLVTHGTSQIAKRYSYPWVFHLRLLRSLILTCLTAFLSDWGIYVGLMDHL